MIEHSIRTIPDYPKAGIQFRDITTLLGNAQAFRRAVDELVQPWAGAKARSGGYENCAEFHRASSLNKCELSRVYALHKSA
jgi:hypothetical protein